MQFATRAPRRPSENIVPLINVVFLLLVFFMLTGTLSPAAPMDVELPTAAGSGPPRGVSDLLVAQDGTLALDGKPIDPDELVARLDGAPGARQGELEVRADARVEARILLPLLARLQQAGLSRLDLVTRRGH